jgi:hypothetical protein
VTAAGLCIQRTNVQHAQETSGALYGWIKVNTKAMYNSKFDIQSENFDQYFAGLYPHMTPAAKAAMPTDLSWKIFKRGGGPNLNNVNKISFLAKLWILWKCLHKRVWIVVEEEDKGLTVEQFVELREAYKKKDRLSKERAEFIQTEGIFITASKELGDTFDYMNKLCTSSAYNFITRMKNRIPNPTEQWKSEMTYICRFLVFYESNKRRWVEEFSLSMPEFLILIYGYHGKEFVGADLHKFVFKKSFNSSINKLKKAFGTLQTKGYIVKIGIKRGAKMQITPMGISVINSILTRYGINC